MRIRLAVVGAVTLLLSAGAAAQAQGPRVLTRTTMKNDVGIELLGKAVIYSFNYQRMVSPSVGLEIGLGALGGGGSGSSGGIVMIPAGVKFYFIPQDGTLYLAAGGVLANGITDEGPFNGGTDAYAYGGLGFEFRSPGGFLFRGTAYSLIAGGGWFIWPGLSVGYAF
jgi:hypothetical protein